MKALRIDRKKVDLLMERAGIETYGDLAEVSGIHPNTLVRILQGGGWQSRTLSALADTLMCHPLDLLEIHGFAEPTIVEPAIATFDAVPGQ